MATEVGESEPIPEILHSVETGTSESSKGKTIIEAPLKETTLQYVTIVSAKLENEGCLTSNGNKDDAAKKFVPEESPNMNEMDAEKNTYDEVTKFDITEVSEAQVRDKEQKLEDEHVEIEAKTGNFGNERINGIDSTQEPLEITAEESPLDAVAIELEAEKLERLKEDKQVQIEAKTGSLNDERSFEIISVAETLKSSEPAGNQTEGGKLEGPFDAVPKDSESLNFKREEDDKNVETEAETGGLGDERASKDIDSIYVRDPSEEESTQESLQTDPRQNLQPAEDDPGGDKLENIKAIPNEPKEENIQQITEEKHDNVEAETGTFKEEITNDSPKIEDEDKFEPAEYKPEGCELATNTDVVPIELEEKNLERACQDEHVKIELETENINDQSSNEIVSVSEPSEEETMQQPHETISEGDIDHAGDKPEGEKLESPLEPVSKQPEAENLDRVEEDNKHDAQNGSLNDKISNEIDHLSLVESAEEEITQDPPKIMTEDDPELAKDEPEDAKLENTLDAVLQELENTLDAVLQEPEAEKLKRVEEDKLIADIESTEGERANDINSVSFTEAEDTQGSLGRMTEETPEPAPEGGKLESSLDEFPNQTEAEKLEIIKEKHVEIEAETGSFSDERANDIDSMYITEPLEKLNAQELESMTEEDLVLAEDESKGEKPLEALLEEPEGITPASTLPHSVPNFSETTSQRETEKISEERECEVGLVLEEIKGGTNSENPNSESDKKDKEVKNEDHQNDAVCEESPISASEDQSDKVTTISTDDTKDNDLNGITSRKLELASELIPEQKSEVTEIETKDIKLEHSPHDENSYKNTETNELSKEGEAVNEVVEDSIGTDAIEETTKEASDMLEDSKKVTSEITDTNELRSEFETANKENKSLKEDDMAKRTTTEGGEMNEDATYSTSELTPTISKDLILQETEIDSDKAPEPISLEMEYSHDSTVDSEADTVEKTTEKKLAKEKVAPENNDEEIHNLGMVENTEFLGAKDIHETSEGGKTPEMSIFAEQKLTENLEDITKLEVGQGKETSIGIIGGERSLEENAGDGTKDSVQQKEIWEEKIENPTKVAEEEIKEINDSQENAKRDSFKGKEECFTNIEIPEMELNDYEGKEKCETNLNNSVDGSPSSHELLDETKDVEVGKTTKVDDETNQSTDKEAYDTECEQHYQVINAKGDVEVDDDKQNGEVEELEFVKELVPRDDNQEGLRELEVTDDTIHDDNLDTVIPESVGDTCNLAPDDAEEAQNKVIQDGDTKNEIIVEEVNKSAVTVETPVSEDVIQVIKADVYECQAYEEKGEHKENTSASLLLEKSVHNEDEKTKEVLDDLAVTSALSDEAAYGQGDQRQQATEEDNRARDGNPNEENDKTVIQNIESAVEELNNNGGRIISDDNRPEIIALNETKEGKNRHEKEADSSNEEKDHDELNEVVVCENEKISEEAESKGGEACTSSLSSQEIEGGELHKTDEIIIEEKQEIFELENNEGEEISNRDTSSSEPNVVESKHLSLQTLKKEEANQEINDTNEEVLEAEQSDIIIAQIEKIAEGIEVLNTKVMEDVGQEMANPTEGIENRKVFEEEATEIKKLAVKTVPRDEDEETKQEVGEKFSKRSDYWPGLYKEETSNANAMTIECSKEILTETDRSPCEINEKGEEVQCAVKASEDTICNGGEKLDGKVNSSTKPIEDKESSRKVVIETEEDDKASNENDESDNLPVSHFLMKHILQEQADNLDRIGNEKYEDPTHKQIEEGKENEMNILKQEEVPIKESMIPETIPEDEAKPENFKNMSESVQEELDHDVKEKPELLVSKDDASKLFEVTTHSSMDDSVELKSKEQSIPDSEVNIEEHKYPNVVQDEKNHSTIVEREMTEMETHKENESQHKYDDIFQKEDGEESKEFHQEIEKVESESQSTKDGCKIEDIFEFESEVNNGESGEEKQQGGEESKFNIKKVDYERQSSKDDGEIEEILEIESEVNKEENEKKQEGGEESKEFEQDIEKVEFKGQSTKADCKIEEILELESEVTKEESEDEKHEVEIKGQREVEELEQPETQNNGEMELKKEREEEYEPDPSTQTSELETTQKCVPTSKTFESSAVEDLDCEEEKEDVMDGNQGQNLKNTKVEDDKTDEEKYENEDNSQEPEESSNKETILVEAREVELKPTHKKSHNILSGVGSKVKHSFAKVKKAITGKSSHTKTLSAK